jgi:PleD family two-component response regulator
MPAGAHADSRDANIPRRVLIVDDDELAVQPFANLLVEAGYEVRQTADGEEALAELGRSWFPVVVTDWHMPVMDGIELVQRLRALAVESSYVIMLTASDSGADYERGYCAGVDQYVSKKSGADVLLQRVKAGFQAIVLRRSVRQVRSAEDLITVDLESGAHTPRHLVGRLQVEMKRAQRLGSSVALICVGIDADTALVTTGAAPTRVTIQQLTAVFAAIRGVLNQQKDWVARLPGGACAHRLALFLPEASAAQAAAVPQSVRNAFIMTDKNAGAASREPKLSFGTAVFPVDGRDGGSFTALDFLNASERSRRGMAPLWPVAAPAPKPPDAVEAAPLADAGEAQGAGEIEGQDNADTRPEAAAPAAPG